MDEVLCRMSRVRYQQVHHIPRQHECPISRKEWENIVVEVYKAYQSKVLPHQGLYCLRDYDDDLELQQDEQAHQSTKEQVATVSSSRECVGTKQLRRADGVKLPKRDVSSTCVSRFSPYGVSGKEAC